MISERTFLRIPIPFKENLYIYPPSVREVIEEDNFNMYQKLLTITQEEIEDEYIKNNIEGDIPTPLQYLLKNSYTDASFSFLVRKAFYFFTKQNARIIPDEEKIIFKVEGKNIVLEKEEYFDFQNLIRESLGMKSAEKPNPNEHPKIRKMKAKARYRDRIKAKQNDGLSLSSSLALICCMGIGLTPLNIGEISYANVSVLLSAYQDKEKYHLDIETLLAGGKNIKPKYWIKNLD